MNTASALKRNCGYPRVLGEAEPTTARDRASRARRDAAGDKGDAFHHAVDAWAAGADLSEVQRVLPDDEVRGWLELLSVSGWTPRQGMMFEVPAGIRWDGTGVLCTETAPHVYAARDGSDLATAGRADVVHSVIEDGHHLVIVRDWKTGKWPVDPPSRNLQTSALAHALCSIAGADGFRRELYYVRDGYLDADDAPVLVGSDEFRRSLVDVFEAAALDDAPRPGPHCEGCWEKRMKRCAHAAVTP